MAATIITNNPRVLEKYNSIYKILFIDGNFDDVLIKVRDIVHQGALLITHPLPANIKLLRSPYRSVVIEENAGRTDIDSLLTIENSILKSKMLKELRREDLDNNEDYQFIDLNLLESSLNNNVIIN